MINSLKVACVAALKGEEERGIWARESARGARGGRKREKRRKGSRFQHPRAPFLTPATLPPPPPPPPPLVKPCIPTWACQMNKLHEPHFVFFIEGEQRRL